MYTALGLWGLAALLFGFTGALLLFDPGPPRDHGPAVTALPLAQPGRDAVASDGPQATRSGTDDRRAMSSLSLEPAERKPDRPSVSTAGRGVPDAIRPITPLVVSLGRSPDEPVPGHSPEPVHSGSVPPVAPQASGGDRERSVAARPFGTPVDPGQAGRQTLRSVRLAVARAWETAPRPVVVAADPDPPVPATTDGPPAGRADRASVASVSPVDPTEDSPDDPAAREQRRSRIAAVLAFDTGVASASTGEDDAESRTRPVLETFDFDRGTSLPEPLHAPPPETALTLAAVGDIMVGASVRHDDGTVPPPGPLDPELAAVLRGADLAIGNLEGVIGSDALEDRHCSGRCYRFRMRPATARLLDDAGFDFLNLANNHADDFGAAGRIATRAALTAAGIAHAGHDEDCCRVASARVRDISIGFVGFGHNGCCLDLRDAGTATALIRTAKTRHDIVVVTFHGGAEGVAHQRVMRQRESFLGIDRGNVFAFARAAVDAGADVVVGSGPHVPRAMEIYRGRMIAYSLGNFWTTRHVSLAGPAALAPILRLWLAADGSTLGFDVASARQSHGTGPRPDPSEAAWHKIRHLTALDFPNTQLGPMVLAMRSDRGGADPSSPAGQ